MASREPVALGALVQVGLNAVLSLLVAFGVVTLSADQTAALYGAANAAVAIIVAVRLRLVTFSPHQVAQQFVPAAPCASGVPPVDPAPEQPGA